MSLRAKYNLLAWVGLCALWLAGFAGAHRTLVGYAVAAGCVLGDLLVLRGLYRLDDAVDTAWRLTQLHDKADLASYQAKLPHLYSNEVGTRRYLLLPVCQPSWHVLILCVPCFGGSGVTLATALLWAPYWKFGGLVSVAVLLLTFGVVFLYAAADIARNEKDLERLDPWTWRPR